jgi:hypothetical protein
MSKFAVPALRYCLCLLALLVVSLAAAFRALPQPGDDSAAPAPNEIVARYVKALGGEDALRRHTSSTMQGEMQIPNSESDFEFTAYAAAPYFQIQKLKASGKGGDVMNGFDGQIGWDFDPHQGPHIYGGAAAEFAKRNADFYFPLNQLSWFKSMNTVGIEKFEGRRCYHLKGITNWDKTEDYFYDEKTGLLEGYELDSDTGPTPTRSRIVLSDYRSVDGVMVAKQKIYKTKSKDTGEWTASQTLTFSSVVFNNVDPAVFVPPQAVRDLAAKDKAAPNN